MAYFPDLTPYTYFPEASPLLNVGWLDTSHPFTQGETPSEFLEKLRLLRESPVKTTRGYHRCPFCRDGKTSFTTEELSDAEIRVRGTDGTVYTSPCLIVHYVAVHRYLPPQKFIDAVMQTTQL